MSVLTGARMLNGDARQHKASDPERSLASEDPHRLSQATRTEEVDDAAAGSRKPRLSALGTSQLRRLRHVARDTSPPPHLAADLVLVLDLDDIKKWVDAHANLPIRARWIAKADVVSTGTTKRKHSVDPPPSEGLLFSDTTIDRDTVQAYLETEYRVSAPVAITLRIGEVSTALADLHRRHGVEASAFITAWNPYSRATSDEINGERQHALALELQQLGLTYFDGVGQHPSNQWKGEPSLLVLGPTLEGAKVLGTRHEQNAIVWCGLDAVPQLILLR